MRRSRRDHVTTTPLRPGGQALLDGVFMRTDKAWAIARADGSIQVGALPQAPMQDIPVARVLGGLAGALKVGVGKGLLGSPGDAAAKRRIRVRLLLALLVGEVAVVVTGLVASRLGLPFWTKPFTAVLTIVAALTAVRVALPAPLWRYHGAEHKAVAAFEAKVNLDDVDAVLACSRVHNRCGTNLVFLLALSGAVLDGYGLALQLAMFVVALGVGAEMVGAAAKRPDALASKVVVAGGKLLQRHLTTAEPTFAEQAIANRSLQACLAEHAALTALEDQAAAAAADAAVSAHAVSDAVSI